VTLLASNQAGVLGSRPFSESLILFERWNLELSSEKFVKILKSYKFSEKKSVSACYFVFSCLLLSLSNLIR